MQIRTTFLSKVGANQVQPSHLTYWAVVQRHFWLTEVKGEGYPKNLKDGENNRESPAVNSKASPKYSVASQDRECGNPLNPSIPHVLYHFTKTSRVLKLMHGSRLGPRTMNIARTYRE